ncbi:MAG: hypothetical protein AAF702_22320 [Chloroflexota bacterium]
MLTKFIKHTIHIIRILGLTILTVLGAITLYQNLDDLFLSAALFQTATAAPGSVEMQSIEFVPSAVVDAQNANPNSPRIGYQGILRDSEGNLMEGEKKITFKIYEELLGDQTLWMETLTTTVRSGQFSVLLGDTSPISETTFFDYRSTYLGVTVDGFDEMYPRQRFSMVPYAVTATNADNLRAPKGTFEYNATYVRNLGYDFHVETGDYGTLFESLGQRNEIEMSTNTGYDNRTIIAHHNDNRFSIGNAQSADTFNILHDGNVGIGTTEPKVKLHVNGPSRFDVGGGQIEIGVPAGIPGIVGESKDGTRYDIRFQNEKMLLLGDMDIPNTANIGTANITGEFLIRGVKPILIRRFENIGDEAQISTGISAGVYECVAAGWLADYDVSEGAAGTNGVWTYVRDNVWWLRATFRSQGNHENPDVDILCFRNEIAKWEGDPEGSTGPTANALRDLNDPD